MKKFKFNLQSVLHHRQVVEDQMQRELAQVLRHRMILVGQLRRMQETITQSKHDLGRSLAGNVDMEKIAQFAMFSSQSTQHAHQIVGKLAAIEKQVEAARARLIHASADRKALELLRDAKQQAWNKEIDRRETAELDEAAVQGYWRQTVMGIDG
jgi:flagellar FliJ protein